MFKRFLICFLVCLIHVSVFAVELYVSPKGNDADPGTKEKPFATLQKALRAAREIRRLDQLPKGEFILIRMSGGVYQLTEPIVIRPEDSGTADSPTVIEGAPDNKTVLSGGITVGAWQQGLPIGMLFGYL